MEIINISMKRNDIDIDHFLKLYDSGMDVKQLSHKFGINISTVYDWLRAAHRAPNRRAIVDHAILQSMYDSGVSVKEMSKKLSVSEKVIRAHAAKIGIIFTRRKSIDLIALRERYDAGISVKGIAKEFGVAPSVILSRMDEIGIIPRNRSEAMYVRMGHTSVEERRRLTDAAHSAVRGVRQTDEHRCKIARTREAIGFKISRSETIFVEMLEEGGVFCTQQKAFGRYNVDIALNEFPIVVEICGGGWHAYGAHAARYAERTKYLLRCGVDVVMIWVDARNRPLENGAADYVIALTKKLGSQKTIRGKEHVIKGNGQSTSIGQRKFNNLPVIPCSERRNKITGRFDSRPFDETIEM